MSWAQTFPQTELVVEGSRLRRNLAARRVISSGVATTRGHSPAYGIELPIQSGSSEGKRITKKYSIPKSEIEAVKADAMMSGGVRHQLDATSGTARRHEQVYFAHQSGARLYI